MKTSLLAGSLSSLIQSSAHNSNVSAQKKVREYYELRTCLLANEAQQKIVEDYYEKAAIPALNKIGCRHIGVFTEMKPENQTKIYVLIPYQSIEDFVQAPGKLAKDEAYQKAAEAYLNAPATAPAYERIESSLLYAFPQFAQLNVPANKNRIFELRRYESPTEAAGKKKIEMFNEGGEIDVFLKTGLTPVFFGECLVGENRPNLTYMLQFDNMANHDTAWKTFGSSAEWNKLKAIPDYADAKLISKITSTFLLPAPFSQI